MRIAQINMIPYGSTGRIMLQIAAAARDAGHTVRTYSTVPYDKCKKPIVCPPDHFVWGNTAENRYHYYLGSILGRNGCYSRKGTQQLIADLKVFQPDIVHLHNLHKFCINLSMLFSYLKESGVRVIWTLHDCWAFTGNCPYFTMVGCEKWKLGCHNCPQLNIYPRSRIDNTRWMYAQKKKWFTGLQDMTIVTPSEWLAGLVKQSFLKDYPIKVIHNGIDLSVFRPTLSDFREKHGISKEKTILLGVSFGWGQRKGLDVFNLLYERLDPEQFQIVLVGTSDTIDKRMPKNILSIHCTQNQTELAEIYTAADLFVNPTREDNYPTVNMEAIACGTPVLTFRTGGSSEMLTAETGSIVECNDIDTMVHEILRIDREKSFSEKACIKHAQDFDMNEKFKEYVKLYEDSTYCTQCSL